MQLDGLAEGWRFSVQRRGQDVEIEPEDFLWLAMASDLPDLERANNGSGHHHISSDGMMLLKSIERSNNMQPLIGLAHNSAAPYSRMLRLFKRYKFAYRLSPNAATSTPVPGQSIAMTSYPGALSSQDESYSIDDGRMIVAGTPLVVDNHSLWSRVQTRDRVMSAPRIMAANRLARHVDNWSRLLDRHNSGTSNRQWLCVEPRATRVALIEQIPGFTQFSDRSDEFERQGYLACTGAPFSPIIRELLGGSRDDSIARAEQLAKLQLNISSVEALRNLMSGNIAGILFDIYYRYKLIISLKIIFCNKNVGFCKGSARLGLRVNPSYSSHCSSLIRR